MREGEAVGQLSHPTRMQCGREAVGIGELIPLPHRTGRTAQCRRHSVQPADRTSSFYFLHSFSPSSFFYYKTSLRFTIIIKFSTLLFLKSLQLCHLSPALCFLQSSFSISNFISYLSTFSFSHRIPELAFVPRRHKIEIHS